MHPLLRHCTFVERDNNQILMIVGQEYFEIEEVDGSRDTFYNVKRYSDGRHSIADISRITGVSEPDIRGIVEEFHALGLMRTEAALDTIPSADFIRKVQDSCLMWMLCDVARHNTFAYLACTSLFEARKEDFEGAKASLERIAANYGFDKSSVAPVIEHMRGDVEADHNSLLVEALKGQEFVDAQLAHYTVNCLHDLKHSFDQFHDQIIQYYSDISNYIPRLKVDTFSL